MDIQTIGVVGAGQMGNGIAHVSALAGYEVVLTDISADALQMGVATVEKNMSRLVRKERITENEARQALGRITTHTDLGALESAELVIEAATEKVDLKCSYSTPR